MKNIFISIISLLCITTFIIGNTSNIQNKNTNYSEENENINLVAENSNFVSKNGQLHVSGTKLKNN